MGHQLAQFLTAGVTAEHLQHALMAQATLQTAWQTLTIPLALTGDAVLTLQHDAPGETVRVRRLALGG